MYKPKSLSEFKVGQLVSDEFNYPRIWFITKITKNHIHYIYQNGDNGIKDECVPKKNIVIDYEIILDET